MKILLKNDKRQLYPEGFETVDGEEVARLGEREFGHQRGDFSWVVQQIKYLRFQIRQFVDGDALVAQRRSVLQFTQLGAQRRLGDEQRRLDGNFQNAAVPLVRPQSGLLERETHDDAIEPEIAEQFVQTRFDR